MRSAGSSVRAAARQPALGVAAATRVPSHRFAPSTSGGSSGAQQAAFSTRTSGAATRSCASVSAPAVQPLSRGPRRASVRRRPTTEIVGIRSKKRGPRMCETLCTDEARRRRPHGVRTSSYRRRRALSNTRGGATAPLFAAAAWHASSESPGTTGRCLGVMGTGVRAVPVASFAVSPVRRKITSDTCHYR